MRAYLLMVPRGVARIFQRGGGGTLCLNEGTHQIVMSFLQPVVGCLLRKWPTKGGITGTTAHPVATPLGTCTVNETLVWSVWKICKVLHMTSLHISFPGFQQHLLEINY